MKGDLILLNKKLTAIKLKLQDTPEPCGGKLTYVKLKCEQFINKLSLW